MAVHGFTEEQETSHRARIVLRPISRGIFCCFVRHSGRAGIPFIIATKKIIIIRYLGINLTKEVKYPYSENHKILKEETDKDTNM